MSDVMKRFSAVVLSVAAGFAVGAHAEDKPADKPAEKPAEKSKTQVIILDGKLVRVDENFKVLEVLKEHGDTTVAAPEEKKEHKQKEEKKEEAKKEEPKAAEAPKAKEEKAAVAAPAPTAAEVETSKVAAAAAAAEAEAAKEKAARDVREAAQQMSEQETKLRAAVRKLASPGWHEAQIQLIAAGKASVPFLIDAMGDGTTSAYNLGGHTKSDAGRAARQRTLGEVCAEVLTELVSNHSTFKGEVPTVNQLAWQTWWTANSATVTFGK